MLSGRRRSRSNAPVRAEKPFPRQNRRRAHPERHSCRMVLSAASRSGQSDPDPPQRPVRFRGTERHRQTHGWLRIRRRMPPAPTGKDGGSPYGNPVRGHTGKSTPVHRPRSMGLQPKSPSGRAAWTFRAAGTVPHRRREPPPSMRLPVHRAMYKSDWSFFPAVQHGIQDVRFFEARPDEPDDACVNRNTRQTDRQFGEKH